MIKSCCSSKFFIILSLILSILSSNGTSKRLFSLKENEIQRDKLEIIVKCNYKNLTDNLANSLTVKMGKLHGFIIYIHIISLLSIHINKLSN